MFPLKNIDNKEILSGDQVQPAAEKKNVNEYMQNVKADVKKKEVIKAIIDAQEKERTQISYELHEQLSQNLATCKLLLDGLHLPESMEEEKIRLRSSMKLLMLTMNEIRHMCQQLNAAPLKMIGLVGVIGDMIAAINQNWQVKVQFHVNGLSRSTILPEDIELSAFRIFQEGMNNIIRHSGATHASVHLSRKNKSLSLSIKDDGKGFDPAFVKDGLGFTNITNRVQYHDGRVTIDSSPGNGCLLEVKLPLINTKMTDEG